MPEAMQARDLEIRLRCGDLAETDLAAAMRYGEVGCDIETTGLNWRTDRICTCQVFVPDYGTIIVQLPDRDQDVPHLLKAVLEAPSVLKIFHFALFDLSFLVSRWSIRAQNLFCTKIASRVLSPSGEHSLQALLLARLNVRLEKSATSARTSNWGRKSLLDDQIQYAASDVLYLPALRASLVDELRNARLLELAEACFRFLPDRVQLELNGTGDPFRY